jgi:hypothetical protein
MSWPGGEIKFFENFLLWIRYAVKDCRGDRMENGIVDDTSFRVAVCASDGAIPGLFHAKLGTNEPELSSPGSRAQFAATSTAPEGFAMNTSSSTSGSFVTFSLFFAVRAHAVTKVGGRVGGDHRRRVADR